MTLTEEQEKWLAALESGEYEQAKGCLVHHDGIDRFCCLGVACTILGVQRKGVEFLDPESNIGYNLTLPPTTTHQLGLYDDDGAFCDGQEFESLASMNDSGRFNFKQIAAFIRANPEMVFVSEEKTGE